MDFISRDYWADVARVEQKRAYYCGPACCQMVLGRYKIPCDQGDAFDKIQTANKEGDYWFSDPSGISTFLNSTKGTSIAQTFEPYATEDFQDALDRILYTIDFLKLPCIALTLAGGHWVVIDGLRANVSPDGREQALGAYIENPWYNEVPDFYSSVDDLSTSVLLPNKHGEIWKDKFIILSDDSKTRVRTVTPALIQVMGGGVASGDPRDAALLAVGLHGFDSVRPIREGGGAPALTTTEVTGLDGWPDYFLVPLDATNTKEFQDFIYVAIEKSNGKLLQIATLSNVLQIYSDQEMLRDLGEKFPGAKIDIYPGLYWKPCQELRSRFNVARRFSLDGSKPKFLLPTGKVVDNLSEFDRGG